MVQQFVLISKRQSWKPLALVHLLEGEHLKGILCFASSTETTHRLTTWEKCLLLRLALLMKLWFGEGVVAELSSQQQQNPEQRKRLINKFKKGKFKMYCSFACYEFTLLGSFAVI